MKILKRKFLDVSTNSCHAATIAFYNDIPVFSWFGGTMEGYPDSSIYIQYGIDGESEKGFGGRVAHWNPILFSIDKRLFLSYKIGEFCDRWQTFLFEVGSKNRDSRIDFVLPAGLNFCVKTKPIILGDMIYCGSSVETTFDWSSYVELYSYSKEDGIRFIDRSNPLSAKKIETVVPFHLSSSRGFSRTLTKGLIQPTLWMSERDTVMNAYMRSSTGLGQIYYSRSDIVSGFMSWSTPIRTGLLNPNSGVDVVAIKEKTYLIHNPSETVRSPLVVSLVSEDHDVLDQVVIQDKVDFSNKTNTPELSYPYMVEKDGSLHIVYTYGRSRIEYVEVKV